LPILNALSWDIFDPAVIIREYALAGRRVDYALSSTPPRKEIFIEVKAIGSASGADRQLFEYAFHEGIPFAILTDGREWNFFLPGEQGSYDERRVQKLDLVERSAQDVIQIFQRYLLFSRVKSGEAIENARSDYQNISRRNVAANKISNAWNELVSEPDALLIDLIAEKAESLCGFRPAPEDVEAFLASIGPAEFRKAVVPSGNPANQRSAAHSDGTQPVSARKISYRVLGQSKHAVNASEALIDILRILQKRNSSFLERLSLLVRARKRNHIARTREDVYPLKPELIEYTMELVPGWWLGTNIANRDKMRIIQKACESEQLVLGKDIVIKLPNAD
jgi:hypothetical protein